MELNTFFRCLVLQQFLFYVASAATGSQKLHRTLIEDVSTRFIPIILSITFLRLAFFIKILNDLGHQSILCQKASYFKVCHQTDPNLAKCIQSSVEKLRPLLIKGIPDLGIPSIEPLSIPEVVIDQGTGSVALRSEYKNIKVYGPSKFVIKDIKIDLEKDKMRIKLLLPILHVVCDYNLDGKIMLMPITGSGLSTSNYTNIDATVTLRVEKIKKNDNIYYNVKDFYINFDIAEANIRFEDLFNGDQDLGEAMNLFLNDNWKQIANEIKPVLEDNIAMILKKFANKIFHKYPRNILLPK